MLNTENKNICITNLQFIPIDDKMKMIQQISFFSTLLRCMQSNSFFLAHTLFFRSMLNFLSSRYQIGYLSFSLCSLRTQEMPLLFRQNLFRDVSHFLVIDSQLVLQHFSQLKQSRRHELHVLAVIYNAATSSSYLQETFDKIQIQVKSDNNLQQQN